MAELPNHPEETSPEPPRKLKQALLIAGGCLSLGLGILGIFLPLLPTTPFLLLSSGAFLRSSPRLYRWLLRNRVLGGYIRSYVVYHAIPLRTKIVVIALLWAVISASAFLAISALWLRILLMGIATGVTIHILRFKTLTAEMKAQIDRRVAPDRPEPRDAAQE